MNRKIIGLPSIVSTRYRIVIDKNLRQNYGIADNDSVLMCIHKNHLQIYPTAAAIKDAQVKDISIGRFNLPIEWAKQNGIKEGDLVYLVGTTDGVLIYPADR